jgi:hypothetical protein
MLSLSPDDGGAAGGDGGGTGGDPAGGAGGGAGGAGGGSGGAGDPPGPPGPAITFGSQKELDDHYARIRRQAERDAEKKLAADLGIPIADAKARLEAANKAERDAMTEADRKLAEAADKETAAERREREAADKERRADLTIALYRDGGDAKKPPVRADRFDAAMTLADAQMAADTNLDVAAAIDKVRELAPELFGTQTSNGTPPGIRPGTPPANGGGNQPATGLEAGRERARKEREARESKGRRDDTNPLDRVGRRVGA